ncbi:glycerophosphodiester phosphodiesterase family protein [Sphingomicrobium sediminis]|uniref:Glycerophosphodiester phosphodiesterase n=1 Tax=Sphingomicrobium sediminis TaxID=2950949 RepID=A0A9X2EIJ5_9SPHN|nr:glycerophosphodiester phosphodiesterase family protein [Sphingomicrobium sediminis]MCM8558170.1 glycerophosphodiester phosphodiesterase [Sphingomicrobium sediminis]
MGFAHRGLHDSEIPENSLAAARAAMEIGAGIECDVQLSGCGTAMLFHDADGKRLCGEPRSVGDTSAEAMRGWRLLDTDEPVVPLAELLDLIDGRVPLLVEMKRVHGNAERIAAATVRALGDYAGPIGLMSFSSRAMRMVRRLAPDVRRGLVLSGRETPILRWDKMRRARPDFLAVKVSILHQPWVAAARADVPVYSWTARTPEDIGQVAQFSDAPIWEGDGHPRI